MGSFKLAVITATVLCALIPTPALSWSNAGHMTTAVIAYYDLGGANSPIVKKIVAIMASHPDRGPFKIAVGRSTGDEQILRTFMEIARWPDDIRLGNYDHPTWHYLLQPVIDPSNPPPNGAPYAYTGDARDALSLNISMVSNTKDPRIAEGERAIALCWIFHIVGDIHQPLHAGEYFSAQIPEGDFAGDKFYLIDPNNGQVVKLHSFWDDLVTRDEEPTFVVVRSQSLMSKYPRSRFAEALQHDRSRAYDVSAWASESHAAAVNLAYGSDRPSATSPDQAKLPDQTYLAQSRTLGEERLTLSGYRLADSLRAMFGSN